MHSNHSNALKRSAASALAAALLAVMPTAFAQTATKSPAAPSPMATPVMSAPASPEIAAIRKSLEAKFPGADIKHVAKTDYLGLYEVMLDDTLVYTDAKVGYIFVGAMYDTATKQNLTDARSRRLNRVAIDKLPYDLAFKRVKGDGSRKLVLFSDADCPFCHRLENEIKGLDNVTIYTFLFPIDQLHPDAARKSKQIWCSPDKVKAWDEFFASGKVPDNKGDCGDPVARTQALGKSLKINATPTLIFANGSVVPGAIPPEQMEAEFNTAAADAKKPVAAGK